MAPKQMKRPAAAAAASPKKAKRAASPTKSKLESAIADKCATVKAAIAEASQLPVTVRDLLVGSVKDSLGVMKHERHECQSTCVRMIGEVLDGITKDKEEAVTAAQGKVEGAEQEKVAREKAANDTETKVAELQAALDAAKAVQEIDSQAQKDATNALKKAVAEQKEGDAEAGKAQAQKESLEQAQAKAAELKEQAADQRTIAALMSVCKGAKFDETLLSMLPAVLKKETGERGTFDCMALSQFEAEFAKHLQKIGAQLQDPEAAKAARAAAVDQATQLEEAAKKKKEDAAAAVAEAATAHKEGKFALSAASQSVASFATEAQGYAGALEDATADLAAYHDGEMAAYMELLELAPPPAEEPAAHAAEAAPELAAAAKEATEAPVPT